MGTRVPWHTSVNVGSETSAYTYTGVTPPKERISRRIRRKRQAEARQVPSIAEIAVRMAAVLTVIVLCLQAVHR